MILAVVEPTFSLKKCKHKSIKTRLAQGDKSQFIRYPDKACFNPKSAIFLEPTLHYPPEVIQPSLKAILFIENYLIINLLKKLTKRSFVEVGHG
jgi:hypothetical protein